MKKTFRILTILLLVGILATAFTVSSYGAYYLNYLGRYQTANCTYYQLYAGTSYKLWIDGQAGMTVWLYDFDNSWGAWCRSNGGHSEFVFTAQYTGRYKMYVKAGAYGGSFRCDANSL